MLALHLVQNVLNSQCPARGGPSSTSTGLCNRSQCWGTLMPVLAGGEQGSGVHPPPSSTGAHGHAQPCSVCTPALTRAFGLRHGTRAVPVCAVPVQQLCVLEQCSCNAHAMPVVCHELLVRWPSHAGGGGNAVAKLCRFSVHAVAVQCRCSAHVCWCSAGAVAVWCWCSCHMVPVQCPCMLLAASMQ